MSLNYTLITDKNIDYKFTVVMNGDVVSDGTGDQTTMIYKGNNILQVYVRNNTQYHDLTAFDLSLVLTNSIFLAQCLLWKKTHSILLKNGCYVY